MDVGGFCKKKEKLFYDTLEKEILIIHFFDVIVFFVLVIHAYHDFCEESKKESEGSGDY